MVNPHARDSSEAQLLGRLVARSAVNELVAAANKKRIARLALLRTNV
jgi:hypothetical protein